MIRGLAISTALLLAAGSAPLAQGQPAGRAVTRGPARVQVPSLYPCPTVANVRPAVLGAIRSGDGREWTTPAATAFRDAARAGDLYNPCLGVTPTALEDVRAPPIVEIDADGEVITGYILADNYFELYVNGKLVGVDSVPFTPFNSSVVRFRAKRPITYAFKLVDWEENAGLGTERTPEGAHHPGDAGLLARFSDGVVTDGTWKAQSFYISPLDSPDQVVEQGSVHATPSLGRSFPGAAEQAACADRCYAVHYPVPERWAEPQFADQAWPDAFTFTGDEMGLPNQRAYGNFPQVFAGASPIWTYNLVHDNLVLARKTVR